MKKVVSDAEQVIRVKIDKLNNCKFSFESGSLESEIIKDVLEGTIHSFNIRKDKCFQKAITMSRIGSGKSSFRFLPEGFITEGASNNIYSVHHYAELLAFLNSKACDYILNLYNPTINIMPDDLRNLPLTYLKHNFILNESVNHCLDTCKTDWDSFEASWDFTKHPLAQCSSVQSAFEVWKEACNARFTQLKANEEELNRIFIDIYGLQDELTPEVADKDVTVRKADLTRDIKSLISYAVGCMVSEV